MSVGWLALIAVTIAIASYIPYIVGTLRKTTKPDASSWLVWGVLTSIVFVAQLSAGGGVGAWVAGFSAVACLVIACIAIKEEKNAFSKLDKWSLTGALLAILLWVVFKDPLLSILLVTLIDAIGFIPTYFKAFARPYEEQELMYLLGSVKFTISLFALEVLTLTTAIYPIVTLLLNFLLFIMIVARRRQFRLEPVRAQNTSNV